MESALKVQQLSVHYDRTPALWDINLEIPAGKLVAIIGPNGSGKTTFIKSLLDLITPISGRIDFFGLPFNQMRKQIAYVPQRESVDWDFPITAKNLILMGRYGKLGLFRSPTAADRAAAELYLEKVDMAGYADRQISQLSGGQQQRIFFARALMQEADLYFMDEAFSGIDLASEKVMMDLLRQLQKEGKTVFVVHHDLSSVHNYFDWVIMLNMRLVAYGEVSEVFNAENLRAAYGKNYSLLDEAFQLSMQKNRGL